MRLVFLGSGAFGIPTLRALAAAHDLLAIVTQPDRPAGRKRRPTPTPVADWAAEHTPDTPVVKPEDINHPEPLERVRSFDADAWVVIAFGQKLSGPLLADRFAVNLHASLLPRWRGAAPINHAVLAGDAQTGNSVIALADRMDAGVVYARSRRPILPDQTAGDLHELLADDGPALVARVLDDLARGALDPTSQDEARVTHARKLGRADAWVDLTRPAVECRDRIHGLNPWPGVGAELDGRPLKLRRAKAEIPGPNKQAEPGTLVDPAAGLVAAGEGALRLVEVQPPGKRPMPWSDYARGHPLTPTSRLTSAAPS